LALFWLGTHPPMQLIQLHGLWAVFKLFELELVEVLDSPACLFQHPFDGADINFTDICCGLDRTAMAQTFDDPDYIADRQLAICNGEPSRSLNLVWQVLQYSLRIALFLPIRSATDRLSASKQLKWAQSGLGQAKNDIQISYLTCVFHYMSILPFFAAAR